VAKGFGHLTSHLGYPAILGYPADFHS